MNWWEKLIGGGIVEPLANYFTKRQEIKAQKLQFESQERMKEHELKMSFMERQIELKSKGLEADANWEMEFARQAAGSWKDEYTLIVISLPAILCFIPGMSVYVARGFEALSKTPAWYQLIFCSLFLATYGIRYWRKTQSDT